MLLPARRTSFGDSLSTATVFSGPTNEQREEMAIYRWAVIVGPEKDFATGEASDLPLTAIVTPPDPFLGSAVFQRMPEGNNAWTGPP